MRTLGLACKACGHLIKTGMLWAAYGRPVFAPIPYACVGCGDVATYASDEAFLVEG